MVHIPKDSLAFYKGKPVRVTASDADKVDIATGGGDSMRVRHKDILLLRAGGFTSFDQLRRMEGDIPTAWDVLCGGPPVTLRELAELAFGEDSPGACWCAWIAVLGGSFFRGTPEAIEPFSREEVAALQAEREAKAAAARLREEAVARIRQLAPAPEDEPLLRDIEAHATGERDASKLLREIGRGDTPEAAHRLLLQIKRWTPEVNPYPSRFRVKPPPDDIPLPQLPDEPRRDLTALPAFAIDDEDSHDPDDALSLCDGRVLVHVADPAAIAPPGSPIDLQAMERAYTLYMPDAIVPMSPRAMVDAMGLGLAPVSPALTFDIAPGADGAPAAVDIYPSLVKVRRLSYEEADRMLATDPALAGLHAAARAFRALRRRAGAVEIRLPEVKVRVADGAVSFKPIVHCPAREMVVDCMLMAGVAAAIWAASRHLPMPHATQPPSDEDADPAPATLSGMFARRRQFRRSQYKIYPEPHSGLGLAAYCQVTSPLRRYLDLVCHQQIRAEIRGGGVLGPQDVLARIGAVEALGDSVRDCERAATRHWTLAHLLRHPEWRGEAILVDRRFGAGTVIVPELGLEERVAWGDSATLDTPVTVRASDIDLPSLKAVLVKA